LAGKLAVCRKKFNAIDFSGVYSTIIIGPLVCFIDHKSIGVLQTSPELWGGNIETVKLFSFRCPLFFPFLNLFPSPPFAFFYVSPFLHFYVQSKEVPILRQHQTIK